MGHHSMDEPSEEMRAAMEKAMLAEKEGASGALEQKLLNAKSPFGASGKFPDGSIDKTDEGEIQFGVTSHRGKVIINFGKPVAWLGMDARQAASLAALLIRHANTCRDIAEEQKSQANAKEHA